MGIDENQETTPKKHRLKQRFEVVKKLGQGTYGKVQLAINKETKQEVAIKTIKKSKIESGPDLIRIRREIQIMSSIQHPHIVHIFEVFENKDKIVLVMQYASGGELYDYLSEKKVLTDNEARRIFRQISAAVYYCHKNNICHRDLKLENVLIDENGNAMLADFGLSNVFDEKHHLNTFCGSPLYASPEIVKGVPYYGPEVDCWSLGVLLYTLVYGSMPFDGTNFKRLVKQISEGEFYEPPERSGASELIHFLLCGDPNERATIVDICEDKWINTDYDHSLIEAAEELANLTPVRLDLLLALAPISPSPSAQHLTTEEEDTDTATESFAYMDGGLNDHLQSQDFEEDEEFLPPELAAEELEGQSAKRQLEGSLRKFPSFSNQRKKSKKSDSTSTILPSDDQNIPDDAKLKEEEEQKKKAEATNLTEETKPGYKPKRLILPKSFSAKLPTPPLSTPDSNSKINKMSDDVFAASIKEELKNINSGEVQRKVSTSSSDSLGKQQGSNKSIGECKQSSEEEKPPINDKEKAKLILKKNIAKAKLTERKLSQASSESDNGSASLGPISPTCSTPTSFFKAPKPFIKNEDATNKKVQSRAEIVLSPTDTLKSSKDSFESNTDDVSVKGSSSKESLSHQEGGNHWERRIEETLKKLAPNESQVAMRKSDRPRKNFGPSPITRSYRKFTFTKDGASITECRKVYQSTPDQGGTWTKVEKKTTITTCSNNPDDPSSILRSDSHSSTGSNDMFDTWTGDTMMCNIMKMKSMFNNLSRDSFSRHSSRRDMFQGAQRNPRERAEGSDSEGEDDFNLLIKESHPVVYGSHGLYNLLQSVNRDLPKRMSSLMGHSNSLIFPHSMSRESIRSRIEGHESRMSNNFMSVRRSLSRERPRSPKETFFRVNMDANKRHSSSPRVTSPVSNHSGKCGINEKYRDSGVESWNGSDSNLSNKFRNFKLVEETGNLSRENSRDACFYENPRHRVEQWLHMGNDEQDLKTSALYGTIRPRKSSDSERKKVNYRSEVCVDQDGQVRKSTFSRTTSEASSCEDSPCHTPTTFQRSENRMSSVNRYTRSYSGNLSHVIEEGRPPPATRPVLHMTVSFKGGRESPILITNQPTQGWKNDAGRVIIRQEFTDRGKDVNLNEDACCLSTNSFTYDDSPSEGTLTPDSLDPECDDSPTHKLDYSDSLENIWPRNDLSQLRDEIERLEDENNHLFSQLKSDLESLDIFSLRRPNLTSMHHLLSQHVNDL